MVISFIERVYVTGSIVVALGLLVLNLRLYAPGAEAYGPERLGPDTVSQLHFIGQALRAGTGNDMQSLFPEGYFFSHVLYGLTWVEVGRRESVGSTLHSEALTEAQWALAQLDSPQGWAVFDPELEPPYGVFYVGWRSWLAGGILSIQPEADRDPLEVERFENDCVALASAFDNSPTPFLTAYSMGAWPVDSVVAMAALRLHDRLLPPSFGSTVQNWVAAAQARIDPQTGLLPHRVEPTTGEMIEGARGSSQSVIERFLVEIDPDWATEQYGLYRQQFVAPFLGVPGVREYPVGVEGVGDVDSGPLLAGFSASATVVEIGAAQVHGDTEVANTLIQASEAVGLPLTLGNAKRYAFGLLPVGDAFLAWSKTSQPWVASPAQPSFPAIVSPLWRQPFHITTALLIGLLCLPVLFLRRLRKPHS